LTERPLRQLLQLLATATSVCYTRTRTWQSLQCNLYSTARARTCRNNCDRKTQTAIEWPYKSG